MKARFAALALGMIALAAAPVFASGVSLNFGFGGPDTTLGTSQSYTSNGATITAYGYVCSAASPSSTATLSNCSATDLFAKNNGSSETGLGLAGQGSGQNEGSSANLVQGVTGARGRRMELITCRPCSF